MSYFQFNYEDERGVLNNGTKVCKFFDTQQRLMISVLLRYCLTGKILSNSNIERPLKIARTKGVLLDNGGENL